MMAKTESATIETLVADDVVDLLATISVYCDERGNRVLNPDCPPGKPQKWRHLAKRIEHAAHYAQENDL
jgi:hypothetical protein